MLKRWSDFRRTQREILRASNVPTPIERTSNVPTPIERDGGDEPAQAAEPSLLTDTLPLAADPPEPGRRRDYGTAGRPLNRQSPFYVGFVGALGVFVAYGLYRMLGQLTEVITLLIVSFFLTLTLNPLVEALNKRRMR